WTVAWALALAAAAAPLAAQDPPRTQAALPTLTPADYSRWESLGALQLDPTGRWLVASVSRVDETAELRLSRTDGQGEAVALEQGASPAFTRDGRWLVYRKGVAPEERERLEDREEPVHDRLGTVDLASGRDTVLFASRSFALRDDGRWVASLGYAANDDAGSDLTVLELATGRRTTLGNVDEYRWQDEGGLLAVTLKTAFEDGNGVVLFDPDQGVLRTLESGGGSYGTLTWRDRSAQLAALRSVESDDHEDDGNDLLVWRDVTDAAAGPVILAGLGRADLPDTLRITGNAGIRFGRDGGLVYVGLGPWERSDGEEEDETGEETPEETPEDAPDEPGEEEGAGDEDADSGDEDEVGPADVQIWHWNDERIIRAQEYFADQDARRTYLAAWHLGQDRLVRLADELDEPARLVDGDRWALVPDYEPYQVDRRWGWGATDWYRVSVDTGERTLLAEGVETSVTTGPTGRAALVHQGDMWHAVDLETLARTPLGPDQGGRFTRSLFDHDYPGPHPAWGVAGWLEDEEGALLYDKHDVWRADLSSGEVTRLTRGAEEGLQYRITWPDPERGPAADDFRGIDPDEPLWLSVRHLDTKASGYARLERGSVRRLVLEDAQVSSLAKARDADRWVLRMERWDDSPDAFVGGRDLGDLRRVTATNPFQDGFAWGRSELLPYTTGAGHDLQAMLIYPAAFQEGQRYPLILYQYERLSDGLHRYRTPSQRDYYNPQVWSQEGYFVLMPDIVYEPGRPGPSALDAVEHALDAAVATGHVDPDAMGLIGHSWGGYQASYLPTRTNRFAASVAGAAITNFVSFMGAVHWNGGLPENGHWETGQGRMAVPFWEDFGGHLESSPVHEIHRLETPVLLMHGDADGVVDFRQGLEYYNDARRAGKEVVLLVYPGADHGLREEEDQVDYHRRILEWFGHYLKGEPAPAWITDGESWAERAKRLKGG
ncbi:MAG TPA: prolyl oligopeptidase family serine peptidase, partial [Longimicrobiales bacterium]